MGYLQSEHGNVVETARILISRLFMCPADVVRCGIVRNTNNGKRAFCFRWHRMGWVALGRCAGGGGRLSSVLSLSLTSLASSLIFTILCILTLALTLVTLVRAEDMYVLPIDHCQFILYSILSLLPSRYVCSSFWKDELIYSLWVVPSIRYCLNSVWSMCILLKIHREHVSEE